ncbi:phage GP46 family protein [Falsiroseomonas sp.]|uniref:phage GP46 family protein n=1 Tax=Falsiroseomonas sp. TaxID=2870721 RepID=UPI00271B752E|nr:phage GP46 family protein [Falsiroseomonas sp.]MDO9501382.1 phage GP46 family protein [Falsiroseomonas sp.]
MPHDLALTYRRELAAADLVWTGTGLGLDATPRSALLLSILADRRARPDDPVRLLAHDEAAPASLTLRGGSAGDAVDARGERTGSRLWLLRDAKETTQTRLSAERYATEAAAWLARRGLAVTAAAAWSTPPGAGTPRLRLVVRAGEASVAITAAGGVA